MGLPASWMCKMPERLLQLPLRSHATVMLACAYEVSDLAMLPLAPALLIPPARQRTFSFITSLKPGGTNCSASLVIST
jgi:hypothetical protein